MRLSFGVAFTALVAAQAGVQAAGAQTVTEEQFLSAFGAESAAVRALGETEGRAEAARARAGALENPRIDFWREQPDANPRVTNWTLGWTPPLDGRFGLGKQAADLGLAAARERFAADKAALRREIRAAFAAWSLASERRAAIEGLLERVRTLAEVERNRARVGEQSGLSARRVALSEAEVRAALRATEAAQARAEALARAWRPDLDPGAVPAPLSPPEPPPSVAAAASPELRALAFEAEQAALEAKRAGRFLTFPTLQIGWQQIDDRGTTSSGPIFAAGWSIPLFDRDKGARIESSRRAQAAAARVELSGRQLAARAEGAAAAYRVLFEAAREAGRILPEADRVIVAAMAAYRAGEASLTDLLDSLRAAVAARQSEIEAREQALEAHRDLEAALGQPLLGGGF